MRCCDVQIPDYMPPSLVYSFVDEGRDCTAQVWYDTGNHTAALPARLTDFGLAGAGQTTTINQSSTFDILRAGETETATT